MVFGTGTQLQLNTPPESKPGTDDLALLPTLQPWRETFFRNLKDFLLFRDWPRPFDRRTYAGWRTACVFTDPPWTRIRESWWGHVLLAIATFAICTSPLFLRPVKRVDPYEHAHIQYYPVSDYLPAINTSAPRPHSTKRADPVLAKQEIISLRPEVDNHTQTVITPPNVKLAHDVPLPNMAVWTADPVAPTVAAPSIQSKLVFPLAAQVVEPTPDINRIHSKRDVPLQNSAVEPIADDSSLRRSGQLNITNLRPDIVPPAPSLPMQAQRATGVAMVQAAPPAPSTANITRNNSSGIAALRPDVVPPQASAPAFTRRDNPSESLRPQVVPPQPTLSSGSGSNSKATGQIIALSVQPADIRGPIVIPAGNRNGEFAAGPNGKAAATGQPAPSADSHSTSGGNGAKENSGPTGVYVAPPPPAATSAPVVAKQTADPPKEMAKLQFPKMHATVTELAKTTKPPATAPADRDPMADKVFGEKRYYSLTLNMPNLNSATGSWVVRFAELNEHHDGVPVVAPVATNKLDPVYPQELARDHVEGTVTLYAVIGRDGTVRQVRVLHSVDTSLDKSAIAALSGWRFVPGTKNGNAVDLEAIVEIPFRVKSLVN